MHKIIYEKKAEIKKLCQKHQVESMFLFGSATTKDNFTQNSDIDILIKFKEISIEEYTDNYFNLKDELEKLLNRKIDLITENCLKNPYFIQSIENSKEELYAV